MKKVFLLLAVSLLSTPAVAQMRATTKQECTRRCVSLADDSFPAHIRHEEKLKQIRDKKAAEKDAAKLKQLASDEENEIERFNDENEKACRYICANNPEE